MRLLFSKVKGRKMTNWPKVVKNDDGIRPAGRNDTCFYCGSKIGEYHKGDCVVVTKKVKVRATIEYEIEVPHFWDNEQIEFHRNEGSWCSDNLINELQVIEKRNDDCLCYYTEFEYIETTDNTPKRDIIERTTN